MSCPPHHFILPPQGHSVVTIGTCACGAKTVPLLNIWTGDEYEMSEAQKNNIRVAAKKRWAVRRAQIAEKQRT